MFLKHTKKPQFQVENVGGKNLTVSSDTVLLSNQFHKLVVDYGSMRVEEGTTGRHLVGVE